MKKHYIIISVISLLVVASVFWFGYKPPSLPLEECSETYRLYAGQPGVNASFLKNYRINDTLIVNATLLVATDSSAWQRLEKDFGCLKSDKYPPGNPAPWVMRIAPKHHPNQRMDSIMTNNIFIFYTAPEKSVCAIDIDSEEQASALCDYYFQKMKDLSIKYNLKL